MASVVKTKNGKKIVLRTPSEKGKRYARQMKTGYISETGEKLKPSDYAFRAGYLTCQRDNANAYNHNKRNKKRK